MASMDAVFSAYRQRQAALKASNNRYADGIVWIAGELSPLAEARIPIIDQGFLHGDMCYDVPSVWNGKFFRLDNHLSRLDESCNKIRLKLPMPKHEIADILYLMITKSGMRDAYVQIIVTRGFKGVRGSRPEEIINRLYIIILPYVWLMSPEMQYCGGSAVVCTTVRRTPPGAMDPTIKNLQWGDMVRGMHEAGDRGADYPFLTDGDCNLTEGSGYNIVLVKKNALYTPDRGVLQGVTRRTVMQIAAIKHVDVHVQVVPAAMAYTCDEIFLCTTAGGILPITVLDGKPVGDGTVGPITKMIWDGYWDLHSHRAYARGVFYNDELGN
ncbi:D-aminoacid aminotransferase-like PLP-dependent enzyme [Trichoderma austrokoningii]